jgi:hypothetical protein
VLADPVRADTMPSGRRMAAPILLAEFLSLLPWTFTSNEARVTNRTIGL